MALIITAASSLSQIAFAAPTPYTWNRSDISIQNPAKLWASIAVSADGVKVAAVASDSGYIYSSVDSGSTWVRRENTGSQNWSSITSSADGTKLAATVGDGSIYTSTDSGATWTERSGAGAQPWSSITSSDDGTKLAAATNYGSIFTSSDSGVTWGELMTTGVPQWSTVPSITSSADGTKLAAVVNGGSIFTSSDSGATWTEQMSAGPQGWSSITSSADGTKLAAAISGGASIYTSTDSGATWVERAGAGAQDWVSITSSADGTKLVAATRGGPIYTSSDGGGAWTQQATLESFQYGSVVMARSGNALYAAGNPGKIYSSTDMGATWIERKIGDAITSNLSYAASSADGSKVIAATAGNGGSYNQQIYTSQDGGSTWSQRAAVGDRDWQRVLSSNDGTRLVAATVDRIFTSSDSGVTWTERSLGNSLTWRWYVAASGDGLILVSVASDGYIYRSTDGGGSWSILAAVGPSDWRQPALSSDGSTIAVNDYYGGRGLYVSTDSGATWTKRITKDTEGTSFGVSAYGTTMSADGQFLLIPTNGGIYISQDGGVSWLSHVVDTNISINIVAASADGSRFMVGDSGGPVYVSNDYGATWDLQTINGMPDLVWRSLYISADGSFAAVLGSTLSYLASTYTPVNDAVFHYSTLHSPAPLVVAQATLSVASSPCSSIENSRATVLGSSGVSVSDTSVSILGGLGYTLNCSALGGSAMATITLGEHYADLTKLRIYKKVGNSMNLTDITKLVSLTNVTQGDGSVLTAITYTLVDGGDFDEDGAANSVIVDSIYIGVVQDGSATLADTGDNMLTTLGVALLGMGLAGAGLRAIKQR